MATRGKATKTSSVSGRKRTPEGAVRRTQMITTYGVGSLVALGEQSYIVSGLDTWDDRWTPSIFEPNLQRQLRVGHFKFPPSASPSSGDGVRIRLFPDMYTCTGCHDLRPFRDFGSPKGKSECGGCGKSLTPSRFIIVCANGHLADFPYFNWVHNQTREADGAGSSRPVRLKCACGWRPGQRDDSSSAHRMSMHSTGGSASLRSVVISCSCGKAASMEGAFGKGALKDIGVKCGGQRPWLGRGAVESGCDEAPRTLQRGSSAAWFPVQRSALSIPPWSQGVQKLLNAHMEDIEECPSPDQLDWLIKGMIKKTNYTVEEVKAAIEERMRLKAEPHADEDVVELDASSELRRKEYEQLRIGRAGVPREEDFECEPAPKDPDFPLPAGFEKVMLVNRLREVRALKAFTRVEAPDPAAPKSRQAALSVADLGWLPAIEVRGEGVFLTLDMAAVRNWEDPDGPAAARAARIRDNHTGHLLRRAQIAGQRKEAVATESPINARFILLHTLAHALINEWSLECGYPAAALRERIYSSDDMAGILLYTATSDSAGSLGGVVDQGKPRRLRTSVESALSRIEWCSQDPPCMESEAAGVDNLNLAACYACVLLPETSCEINNTFLDRALLIGTPENPEIGFFTRG